MRTACGKKLLHTSLIFLHRLNLFTPEAGDVTIGLRRSLNMYVEFGPLERALHSLLQAVVCPPRNDLESAAVINRFEYSFNLTWKTSKRVLARTGIDAQSHEMSSENLQSKV